MSNLIGEVSHELENTFVAIDEVKTQLAQKNKKILERFTFLNEELAHKIIQSENANLFDRIHSISNAEQTNKIIPRHTLEYMQIKQLLLTEIEVAEKDVIVFKDAQLEILKDVLLNN